MRRQKSSLFQRVLRQLLVSGRGDVRAMEEALHLSGIIRFVALFAATIVLPSLLLAYFGVLSISVEEQDVMREVTREARGTADSFWSQVDRDMSGFEDAVENRLAAGRSPLESRGELHSHLLVALRFSEDGELLAPFVRESPSDSFDLAEDLFQSGYLVTSRLEHAGASQASLIGRYADVARRAKTRGVAGRARLDQGRLLFAGGNVREASRLFARVILESGAERDPWGFRLRDLVRLERAAQRMQSKSEDGAWLLRSLVDDLLAERWTVGQGGEPAVVRNALAQLEPYGEQEWAAVARQRVAERSEMLYWTGRLLPELDAELASTSQMRVDEGRMRWRAGTQALWATTWWDGNFYAFGIGLEALISELKADARGVVRSDAPIVAYLTPPGESVGVDVLARKGLEPWLTGWSYLVTPRDPQGIRAAQTRKRNQRLGIVGFAIVMIGFGALLSAGLIKRELDVARMKTDFAASVSHELRSPITQIRLKGEMLMMGMADTDEERDEYYQAIVRESERLSRLVDNVLDFAAIERGNKSYHLRGSDIEDTVLRAIDSVSSSQELIDKELDVDLPGGLPEVFHDSDAIAQCVINLVSNAAKYSPAGGWIGVRGRVTELGVEILISDRGIGIPAQDLKHIFEPFFRSEDKAARMRKGTGIGLTITRYIMEAHGGLVSVQSRPGHGSTFALRFPLEAPPGAKT